MRKTILSLFAFAAVAVAGLVVSCDDKNEIVDILPAQSIITKPFSGGDYKAFVSPDKVHYPQTWFHYIGGNVSFEGITADLEAIAAAGISGVQLFHGQFGGKWPATGESIECLSENWDKAVRHTAEECRRLGLRFTMQNCPGWSLAGGPWIKPENAMRTLVYHKAYVDGKDIDITLAKPQPSGEDWRDYQDIVVLAFPTVEGDTGKALEVKSVKGSGEYSWTDIVSGKKREGLRPTKAENPHIVEMRLASPAVIRSIEIPAVQSMNHAMSYEPGVRIKAYAIKRGGEQEKLVDATLPPSSWQDDKPLTFACEDKGEAVACRIEIVNKHNLSMGRIGLYSMARKNSWESEAGWTLRGFERTGDDIAPAAELCVASESVLDISQHMTQDGHLKWEAPEQGKWTIMRIGHINEGKRNGPAPKSGTGWECDKLSTEGSDAHFAGYIGRLLENGLQDGMLRGLLIDSWECKTQMWTNKMEQEFAERKGYELRRWMPALFGYVVDSADVTSRFLLDWRGVVGDLFADKFFGNMAELGHKSGLNVVFETAAGDTFPADIMEYFKYSDVPMCEFWHPFSTGYVGSLNFKPIKPTASAARIYGKPRVAAESFTSFSLTWDEHFEMLKEYADYHFIEGVTHNVFHTYTHNPQVDYLRPGTSMGSGIGSPFLRGQTWWPYMKEFTTYLARCSYMLERGLSQSEVLWYLGDEISHKPDEEYPFPKGYKYDYCNPDVLLNRLSVKDGKVVTPEGLSYSLIWIPDNKRMLPETLERLCELVEAGATVVANAPLSLATLADSENAQQRFDKAVKALWAEAKAGEFHAVGNGRILCGVDIAKALEMAGVEPKVKGDVRWLHRAVKGADWFFVTPSKQKSFNGEVEFLAEGAAELWDPVTGERHPLNVERQGAYAKVSLDMHRAGSCFVVFTHKGKQKSFSAPEYVSEQPISSQWLVEFPEGWGVDEPLTVDALAAWCDMPLSAEGKAFSGSVTYTTTFSLDNKPEQLLLDLGAVDMIAEVIVNDEVVRTLWCKPYSVDIADFVKRGENSLKVKVTSTWFNRLVYDASQPEHARKTWVIRGPSGQAALRKAGLRGPVVLKFGEE